MASPVTPTSAFAIYSTKGDVISPGTHNNKKKTLFTEKGRTHKSPKVASSQSSSFSPCVVLNRLDAIKKADMSTGQKVPLLNVQQVVGKISQQHDPKKLFTDISSRSFKKKTERSKIIENENKKSKIRIVLKTGKKSKQRRKIKRKKNKVVELISVLQTHDLKKQYTNEVNPVKDALSVFEWLIRPITFDVFFNKYWERYPLHIQRCDSSYYRFLMSTRMIDDILRQHNILYTKNIDITSYSNGQRETHNPLGRALPSVVWDYYSNGCSIRMLNPQTYIEKIHLLNATLQELFGCFVGANFYLTPPGSQGFAPHYDDIEAFILQIEGKKRWRLYKPRTKSEYLARYSSDNLNPSEIGEPIIDVVLEAGDFLYFPRGTIHQGETLDDSHSLHLTLSVYQKNSWGDYLEKLLPAALNATINRDSELREGLPLNYLNKIGFAYKDDVANTEFRQIFIEKTKKLLHKVIENIDIDAAVDQMAKNHIHDYLPPFLTPVELECSVLQDGEKMGINGQIENRVEIEPDTNIRLARSHGARLVEEEDTVKLYYSADNSKEYHEYDVQFLDVGKELAPAVMRLILSYPKFIKVDELPIEGEDNKVQVARDLWEKCIVVTDVPLPIVD